MAQSYDPAYWRQRAWESRQLAERLTDPVSKDVMAVIADSYERLARQAEQHRGGAGVETSGTGDIATPGT